MVNPEALSMSTRDPKIEHPNGSYEGSLQWICAQNSAAPICQLSRASWLRVAFDHYSYA